MTENTQIQNDNTDNTKSAVNILEAGTYEILKNRLAQDSTLLQERLHHLNKERKEIFGSIETALITTERVSTENNCVPWDMIAIGQQFIFGYNVHIGLKVETQLSDVFSIFSYQDRSFKAEPLELLNNESFIEDFHKLYTYYKKTRFVKFAVINNSLFMVFNVGKNIDDVKTFKWQINGQSLTYKDNRSDHEYKFPIQHEFNWKKTNRDYHRDGDFPHVSIEDQLFVETINGELTIKVEDNTDEGKGIYHEKVENEDQKLEDAEIYYAILGDLFILKIRPYQEKQFRYFVYNAKLKEARRVDAIKDACILLPDDYGILFSNGYYLQSGEYKLFENQMDHMVFEKRISSPNGEDFLFVFYNKISGIYLLLPFNIIDQNLSNPIVCHGYSIFENGELIHFKGDSDAKKHHAIQIWQTPFVGPNFLVATTNETYLSKIGNKEIVKAMAECHEIIALIDKGDIYENLYADLVRITTDLQDSYHWLSHQEAQKINEPLEAINKTANSAIAEFYKVSEIKKNTNEQANKVFSEATSLSKKLKRQSLKSLDEFVTFLNLLREIRGKLVSCKELRYVDMNQVESIESTIIELTDSTSNDCIQFLLRDDAMNSYEQKVLEVERSIEQVKKIVEADELEKRIVTIASELDMLIEIVTNLSIKDTTETTRIIDNISIIYASFNKIKANLKTQRKVLSTKEGKAEFGAQIKLIDQGIINYLDLCDEPDKCDEYLTKLMVQLEELEGKFSEFDEYIERISVKREEIYNAFEAKKVSLTEARSRRAATLMQSGERIVSAIKSRVSRLTSINDINSFMASDLLVEKLRNIIDALHEHGDSVKSDDLQSQLKSLKEEGVSQLKDKQELFVDGKDIIKFGNFQFSVNNQPLELTIVPNLDGMAFHISGTSFFEQINDEAFNACAEVWDQAFISESNDVYKGEYLAYILLQKAIKHQSAIEGKDPISVESLAQLDQSQLTKFILDFMSTRYQEGYIKGVHDHDAALLLQVLINLSSTANLLRYSADTRAAAKLFWELFIDENDKEKLLLRLKGVNSLLKFFPDTKEFDQVKSSIQTLVQAFLDQSGLFKSIHSKNIAEYLFYEITAEKQYIIDAESAQLYEHFTKFLTKKKAQKSFNISLDQLKKDKVAHFQLISHWIRAYIKQEGDESQLSYLKEAAALIATNSFDSKKVIHINLRREIKDMVGSHSVIENKTYQMDFNSFMIRMDHFKNHVVPMYLQLATLKKTMAESFAQDLRIDEFKPKVLTSFVRNQLIDSVYLPMVGANLAKQIGTVGTNKRTDLMGLLLLISPPGYGKTTLMEYIANRLGLVFVKVNGPAIGHRITSVDPTEATNAGAREELEKLNLAFEMGDNIMIYLDDIQHCNPEFLQKFISLCDGQRKIEGVYKGKGKTYDFRGKKVAVVMAGNPYTESGEKFTIPDMLANRADIYNLGDIIGDNEEHFKLSYLENCVTSNPILSKLANQSRTDLMTFIKIADTDNREGITFESNHSSAEVEEYINVLKKLFIVRDTLLTVNTAYMYSAAQSEEYRTEPPFKLQGSYRDMNKIAEKVFPVMNEVELTSLIDGHYENEAQTLAGGTEANLLKFKELQGKLGESDKKRWEEIIAIFRKHQKLKGLGGDGPASQMIEQMENINIGLKDISGSLSKMQ